MKFINIYFKGVKVTVSQVSDDDFERLDSRIWFLNKDGYAERREKRDGKRITTLMHRDVAKPSPHMFVDHINGDRLDNRRCNLREVTKSQNNKNRGAVAGNLYRVKGVKRFGNSWQATIRADGRVYYLGSFKTGYEAAVAYNESASRLHGDFARLNDLAKLARNPELTTYIPPRRAERISAYKGVYWIQRSQRWRAYLSADSKNVHLGYFPDELDAIGAIETYIACV